jgi:plasmid stabilization system protein ParE
VVEGYKVAFSPPALEDLESSLAWLEEEAPEKVVEWDEAIKAHINTLRELPEAHPVAPQNGL